jgi:2-polyprenyl-3-methyl-5-hydroxy-6-metoxy-1,4-benzoquinol methylase
LQDPIYEWPKQEYLRTHYQEVLRGERFQFGENWRRFLRVLTERRIAAAEQSLRQMLEVENLEGRRFLDIGSGSGLFSLAARRLGAWVHSFDYDPQSVACTQELKRRYYPGDQGWSIAEGSVLDAEYLKSLGKFDVVYSWGVLHHTGAMWQALEHATIPVREGGKLYIAIYNDQGGWSARWKKIKRTYNHAPNFLKPMLAFAVMGTRELFFALISLSRFQIHGYVRSWTHYDCRERGMSRWHDIIDWIGGYPFEVAKPEQIFDFYRGRGFTLERISTSGGGMGCNEFVFENSLPSSQLDADLE